MKGRSGKQKGFTLIEVLIVVVIIGVLAALIIPRFLTAPEKAIVAEANQMLGSLVRAEQAVIDLGGTFVGSGALSTANWTSLGLNTPTASKFSYSCTTPSCTASRTVSAVASTAVLNSVTQGWSCTGSYTTLTNGGCTVA
jgi:prepilin-type N-terminal cleavage/methylation domain-containing protein